nr:MAG TPA: hypothetical protein [Caudoviricetes sp.]
MSSIKLCLFTKILFLGLNTLKNPPYRFRL